MARSAMRSSRLSAVAVEENAMKNGRLKSFATQIVKFILCWSNIAQAFRTLLPIC